MENKIYSLLELNNAVSTAITRAMPSEYWVQTEIAELRENRGHCYLSLVEKDEHGNTPKAQARAACWASTWVPLAAFFFQKTGTALAPGMKVLIRVKPNFHAAYGFSWIVTSIDPTYTVGDMARKRREIIAALKAKGIIDMNKSLTISPFVRRVAVISAPTAAGWGDFSNQLSNNEYGYIFNIDLYPSIMQGEGVEQGVISALQAIFNSGVDYDVVVIIRGGGATSDMSGFDSLPLAEAVAQYPTPIIVGIGHERDECVLDIVAHTSVKTPTAAAALLISIVKATDDRINTLATRMTQLFMTVKMRYESTLDERWSRLKSASAMRIEQERHKIEMLATRAKALDPLTILKRGYTITYHNGKALRDPSALKAGDELTTRTSGGNITSIVKD